MRGGDRLASLCNSCLRKLIRSVEANSNWQIYKVLGPWDDVASRIGIDFNILS
jgi:hypothetical protein